VAKNLNLKEMYAKGLWFIASLLFLITVIAGIGNELTMNAAKYAEISREIVESGDWINLTVAGEPYDQKPPLMFWISALFFSLFGISDVVFRLSIFLFSIIGIASTYKLATLLYGRETGILSGVFWAGSIAYIFFHNDAHTDTVLSSMVILAIWQFANFFEKGNQLSFFAGLFAIGLAMLAKGPVGMAIPAFAVGTHLILKRRWKDIFNIRWLWAIPIIGLCILPALAGLYNQFGIKGIIFYFWTNNMGRITGTYAGSNTDIFFYLHTALYMLAPFTIFAFVALYRKTVLVFKNIKNQNPGNELYTFGGIVPFILILSIAKAKFPHYMLSIIPLIMILAAHFAIQSVSIEINKKLKVTINVLNYFIASIFWVAIGLFVFWIYPENRFSYWIIIVVFVLTLIFIILKTNGLTKRVGVLLVSILAFLFSLNYSFYSHMKTYHAPFQAVKIYNKQMTDKEEIHIYRARYWEIFFYAKYPGVYYDEQKKFSDLLQEKGDWVFTDEVGMKEITALLPETKITEFYHRQISRQTPAFLNPKTRQSKLSKLYLLKLPERS
jgi:4-amino-4-deoxy-L-arabinose transferase-like glycosyltransferase